MDNYIELSIVRKNRLCFDDLENYSYWGRGQMLHVNRDSISTISEDKEFILPFSGKATGKFYFEIALINGDVLYLTKEERSRLKELGYPF